MSRGLGRAMVLRLGKMGVDGIYVQADASSYEGCEKVVNAAVEKFGDKIDVLVNNAGASNNAEFYKQDHEDYEWLVRVNLLSVMHMTRLVLPYMVEAKEGNIINISSIGGLMGVVNQVDYCATKSGIIGFTRALALEYASKIFV